MNSLEEVFLRDGIHLQSLSCGKLANTDTFERIHAYLIVAHNEFDLLEKELQLLDNQNADIYIHIDARCKNVDFKRLESNCTKSRVYFVKRIKVIWGAHSQIQCTLNMLETATQKGYQYYHLLSGVDLPLKTPKEMDEFFDKFNGYEFMECKSFKECPKHVADRIKYYHFFRNIYGRNTKSILCSIENRLIGLQKNLKVNRIRHKEHMFYKGANWFSITHKMSVYILNNKKFIKKYCFNALCSDEIFIQTLAMKSPYANDIIRKDLRYIDWKRGKPYVFGNDDYEELMSSGMLFARKFSSEKSSQVINKIYNGLKQKMQE